MTIIYPSGATETLSAPINAVALAVDDATHTGGLGSLSGCEATADPYVYEVTTFTVGDDPATAVQIT